MNSCINSIHYYCFISRCQDSSIDIALDCGLDGRVSFPGRGQRCVSSPQRPDRIWSTPSLLSNRYRGLSPLELKWLGREADHSHLVPKSKMVELNLSLMAAP